ncbi:MAG: ABC transporter permease [Merismopedia sp. SIO2A8]|nr:ABC transporter permease [Symploca sp. SIO2B6]NET47891.1 ABC transporter permease [Merismopedia sp. SIO2A8]
MQLNVSKKVDAVPFSGPDLQTQALREKVTLFAVAIAIPSLILIVWEMTTRQGWVDELFLPSLSGIVTEFFAMIRKGYAGTPLVVHVLASLKRVFMAFSIGTLVGLLLGLLMGYYKYVRAAFYVLTEILRPIPPLAFITLFILWFGIGEVSKVLIILYAGALIVMLNTISGVQSCPKDKILAARTLGANDMAIFLYVILPAALPNIFTGMRVALSVDFGILVAAELLAGNQGIGYIIQDASTFFNVEGLFVGILMIGFFGVMSDIILRFISRRIVHWQG